MLCCVVVVLCRVVVMLCVHVVWSWCGVWCGVAYCCRRRLRVVVWCCCVVCVVWHAEKPKKTRVLKASGRVARTHGDVLNRHTEARRELHTGGVRGSRTQSKVEGKGDVCVLRCNVTWFCVVLCLFLSLFLSFSSPSPLPLLPSLHNQKY